MGGEDDEDIENSTAQHIDAPHDTRRRLIPNDKIFHVFSSTRTSSFAYSEFRTKERPAKKTSRLAIIHPSWTQTQPGREMPRHSLIPSETDL